MAVKLRLKRMGAKKKPYYRVVAADSRSPRDGKFIEVVGTYNPLTGEKNINEEIALKWLNNGATPTDTVRDILSKEGILKEFHEAKMAKKRYGDLLMSVFELEDKQENGVFDQFFCYRYRPGIRNPSPFRDTDFNPFQYG